MRVLVTVGASFFAGHILPGQSRCGRAHGHDWAVRATLEGGLNPKTGVVVDHGDFDAALARVLGQFDGRDLGELLPGLPPSPETLIGYIREQLLMEYPNIVAIEVNNGLAEARGEWELR